MVSQQHCHLERDGGRGRGREGGREGKRERRIERERERKRDRGVNILYLLSKTRGVHTGLLGFPRHTAIGQHLERRPSQRCHSVFLIIILMSNLNTRGRGGAKILMNIY